MAVKFTTTSAQAVTTLQKKSKGKEEGPSDTLLETVGPVVGSDQMATIGYRLSHTVNLGNYESLRCEVSLHIPAPVTDAGLEGAYQFTKDWVDAKLTAVMAEVEALKK